VSSAEIVFSTPLLKQIELLQWLQSVNSKDQFIIGSHTESAHVVLELDIIEDDSSNVVGVLFGQDLIWACFNLRKKFTGVILNCFWNLLAGFSGMIVLLCLRETNSEWEISIDWFKISLDCLEEGRLWVLLYLSGFGSGGLMSCNISISNSVGSNIWESSKIFVTVRMSMVLSERIQLCSLSRVEEGSKYHCEFHYFIYYLYYL